LSQAICLDLRHQGLPGVIGAYVIPGIEPTVVDPGPTTAFEILVEGLAALGVGPRDLRHVALTHVHLDHAGATGDVVRTFPEAMVHIHVDGVPHLVDPTRLVASARRTFGEDHDRLWGEMRPVPADRIRPWRPGAAGPWKGLRPLPTPGHIAHHLAYLDDRDGTLFSGDSMGVVLADEAPTHAPTPPPGVDLRAWARTLDDIAAVAPERFGPTHFGFHGSVAARVSQLRQRLEALEARVRDAMGRGDADADAVRYDEEIRDELAPYLTQGEAQRYFDVFKVSNDYAGVRFYLERNP